ncbi:hypothetical protein B0H14DRAFT_3523586 [Mycena olivaceomarginata]|nr:hypothetical protein B0H14DRAFT_3523586 [Mycena olivaceomarginata]
MITRVIDDSATEKAWRDVDVSTIRHYWRHVGILPATLASAPGNVTIPVTYLLSCTNETPTHATEQELERCLNGLEECGVLQRANRLSLADLLNPAEEHETERATVEDICVSRLAQENSDAAGGDDDHEDDADLSVPPSRREAFAAVSKLQKFTATLNDDFARKLEIILASFGQTQLEETTSMKTVPITNFFQKAA